MESAGLPISVQILPVLFFRSVQEADGGDAAARMRADGAADHGDHDLSGMETFFHHFRKRMNGLLILAVAEGKQLLFRLRAVLGGIVHQGSQGFLAAPHGFEHLQGTVCVNDQDGLHIQRFGNVSLKFGKTAALDQIGQGVYRDHMVDVGAVEFRRLQQKLFGRAVLLHDQELSHQQAEAGGSAFGVENGQVKIGMILQNVRPGDIRGVEGPGDPRREAQIEHAVSPLGIGAESVLEHGRIDVIGTHISGSVVQNMIKFLCFYGFPVQIIHIVDHHGGGDDVQSVAVYDLLRQIGSGVGNDFQHKVPPISIAIIGAGPRPALKQRQRGKRPAHFLNLSDLSHLIQQPQLGVIQLLRKVHIDLMGVDETPGLIPQGIQLLPAVFPDLHDAGRGIDAFSVQKDGDHQVAQDEASGRQKGFLPGLQRIEQEQRLVLPEGLVGQGDEIRLQLSGFLFIDPVDDLVSGIGDLFTVLGELDLGNEGSVLVHDGGQLVHAAEGRPVLGGDHVGPHAPGGHRTALGLQAVDQVLVQVVGGGDDRVRKACFIQHFSGFLGKIGQVAAVQADAVEGQGDPRLPHLGENADGVGNTGF